MAVNVSVETNIGRPREEVAAFVMDPANDRRWIGALTSVRVLDGGALGVGTQVERIARFLGKNIVYVNEVVELTPGERLAMRSVKAPFQMQVSYDFADTAGGTKVTVRAGGDAGGYYRLAGPFLPFMVKSGIKRDLKQLKQALEQVGAS